MNTVELIQFTMGAAFDVLGQVTADLTQEQTDWRPPGKASSIGSIYWHTLTYVDYFVQKYCIEGERQPVRVSYTDGFDGLPVPSPDGGQLAWPSTRRGGKGQIMLARWNHEAALAALRNAPRRETEK